jgi:hypothetical protein
MTYEQQPRTTDSAPGELDEFLARAVDRQIAEQRALRETLTALTQAVNALGAQGASLDPDDLSDRVRAATRAAIEPIVAEMRTLGDNVVTTVQRSAPTSTDPVAPSDDIEQLNASVGGVAADIEGIARALIDLNAGLRDWAAGVDATIASVREGVEEIRAVALADQERMGGREPTGLTTGPHDALVLDVPDADLIEGSPLLPPRTAADERDEIAKRIKDSVELSLYLADQIEEFDRVLKSMGDLPQRLEGVVAQGMRRTLAARAKLDSEATIVLDDALASLDEYVDKMSESVGRFGNSEETLRKLGLGQVELASRLDSLYEAVHELAQGSRTRAASLTKAKPKRKPPAPKPARTAKATKERAKRATRAEKATKERSKRATRRTKSAQPPDAAPTD